MYRFGIGQPPEKKAKKTPEDKKAQQSNYEKQKRERTFQKKWESEFPWVIWDPQGKTMFCKPCRGVYGPLSVKKIRASCVLPNQLGKYSQGAFVTGCSNLKHTTLADHEKSEGHKAAAREYNRKPGESQAEKIVQQLNDASFMKLDKLFRTVHAIAIHCRPFTDFTWMLELDEKKGIVVGNTYRNDKECRAFIHAIAAVERQKIETVIAEAPFLSILSDGSTDLSVTENEIVYIRTANQGKVEMFFVGLVPVERANAPGIYGAIKQSIQTCCTNTPLPNILKKTVAFASDGASVNVGHKSGVISLMRQDISPSIVMVRCLVHRIELAYKDAILRESLFDKATRLLSGIFAHYHTSALQRANLKAAFGALGMKITMPTRIGGTRWCSHTVTALDSLWKGYRAMSLHLGQVKELSIANSNIITFTISCKQFSQTSLLDDKYTNYTFTY